MNDTATDPTKDLDILHTMLRVKDLEETLDFYTRILGMKLLRRIDFDEARFSLAFVGYKDEFADGNHLELTWNWDQDDYDLGDAFGHIALAVPDCYALCDMLKKEGVEITREPGPMIHGGPVMAFIKDPNGYSIELVELKTDDERGLQ